MMAVLTNHLDQDGRVVMTEEEYNSFSSLEQLLIKRLIDNGRAKIITDPAEAS